MLLLKEHDVIVVVIEHNSLKLIIIGEDSVLVFDDFIVGILQLATDRWDFEDGAVVH